MHLAWPRQSGGVHGVSHSKQKRVMTVADATIVAPWALHSVASLSLTAGKSCGSDNESDESYSLQDRKVQVCGIWCSIAMYLQLDVEFHNQDDLRSVIQTHHLLSSIQHIPNLHAGQCLAWLGRSPSRYQSPEHMVQLQ